MWLNDVSEVLVELTDRMAEQAVLAVATKERNMVVDRPFS